MISIKYKTRRGETVTTKYTLEQAIARLQYLEEDEEDTKRFAPTDSGDVRFENCAECMALKASLGA